MKPPDHIKSFLSEKALEEITGISTKTWQRYRTKGGGPKYIKIGSRVLYDPADINSYLESKKVASTSAYQGGRNAA